MSRAPERVLFLLPSLTGLGGGIELYLQQLLGAVGAARPDARLSAVLAREPRLARPDRLSPGLADRLRVVGAPAGPRAVRIATLIARATVEAARFRPDLVVCGHVNLATLAWTLARATGARLLALTYGVEAWSIGSQWTARALRAADRVVAISSFTAAELHRSVGVAQDRIAILHNAVDLERFHPGPPSRAVAERLSALARPRLVTVCRLDDADRYKGVDQLLRAIAEHPGLAGSYLVVGDGSDRPRLERLAAELKVPATFWGRATDDELADLYRACDLFVMPSQKEGFGYVFIEAMACGLPVVAGGLDGSVDALAGGALGLLVDPRRIDEIAAAIRAHLTGASHPTMRDPQWLHAQVGERFSTACFEARLASILSTTMDTSHRAR
jgi:glycosyltransferase involved in cell wall biosynthesis